MGSSVIYRKYRSQALDDVLGQKHITETLKKAIKSNRLGHAYLFTGPRGVGKTSIARILAFEIIKAEYQEGGHIDIIEMDAASNRRIDEIRDLRDSVHIAPSLSDKKVYIIDEVHMLTKEAFNALLKTLEEPPEHVAFILATTEEQMIPETIASRTQRFNFRLISEEDICINLKAIAKAEKINATDDALQIIAEHAAGSLRDAQSIFDHLASSGDKLDQDMVNEKLGLAGSEAIKALIEKSKAGDLSGVAQDLTGLKQSGKAASQLARQLSHQLRNAALESTNNVAALSLLTLARNVLETSGSIDQFLALELALHQLAPKEEQEEAKPQAASAPTPIQNSASESEPKKPAAPAPVPADKKPRQSTSTSKVPAGASSGGSIADIIKAKSPGLASILRLASLDLDKSKNILTIHCSFPFHKSKLEKAENAKTLLEAVQSEYGDKTTVELTVSEPGSSGENPLDKIRDVMGGGEEVILGGDF